MNEKQLEIDLCIIPKLLSCLGKKWSVQILHSFIKEDYQSYNCIVKKFKNKINHTLLSRRLAEFETHKLIYKNQEGFYIISSFGKDILKLFHDLKKTVINNNLYIPNQCKLDNCLCCRIDK